MTPSFTLGKPRWRHETAEDQEKAASIGLMETRNGGGPGKSGIHRPDGDTKRRLTRKKRHPSA
ncbi:hypothetical protein AB5I83_13960 [Mesobacillus sp. LC4]